MDAAGFLSLLLLERDGQPIPAKVARFDEPKGPTLPDRSPELLLAMLLWCELSPQKQARIKRAVRCMAYADPPDPCALQLRNMLRAVQRKMS
jgi:hypothetical protein